MKLKQAHADQAGKGRTQASSANIRVQLGAGNPIAQPSGLSNAEKVPGAAVPVSTAASAPGWQGHDVGEILRELREDEHVRVAAQRARMQRVENKRVL